MSLKKSIHKTKNFFFKTIQSLKNYLFGSYEKIPRIIFLNPLSCTSIINQRSHELDYIYPQYTNQLEANLSNGVHQTPSLEVHSTIILNENDVNHNKDTNFGHNNKHQVEESLRNKALRFDYEANNGAYLLANKMKEFEMMDLSDIDQSLDVEEALHYYSRLSCPVYVDIVNKFFMDMYADFLPQQSSVISTSTSSRRLGPLTL